MSKEFDDLLEMAQAVLEDQVILGHNREFRANTDLLGHLCLLPSSHRAARHATDAQHLRGTTNPRSLTDRQDSPIRPLHQ